MKLTRAYAYAPKPIGRPAPTTTRVVCARLLWWLRPVLLWLAETLTLGADRLSALLNKAHRWLEVPR